MREFWSQLRRINGAKRLINRVLKCQEQEIIYKAKFEKVLENAIWHLTPLLAERGTKTVFCHFSQAVARVLRPIKKATNV